MPGSAGGDNIESPIQIFEALDIFIILGSQDFSELIQVREDGLIEGLSQRGLQQGLLVDNLEFLRVCLDLSQMKDQVGKSVK